MKPNFPLQLSLLHASELTLYTTQCHNVVVVFVANLSHLAVVLITGISSIFIHNTTIIWIVSDLCMFFVFAASCFVALYTGTRILLQRTTRNNDNRQTTTTTSKRPTMTSYDCSNCPPSQSKQSSKPTTTTGEDNLAYVVCDGDTSTTMPAARKGTDISVVSSTVSMISCDDLPVTPSNNGNGGKKGGVGMCGGGAGVPRCYSHTRKRATCTVRRIGSHEGSVHAWKFVDRSLRKVSILINAVGLLGLVMCVTIVISISEAKIFVGDNVKAWEWYLLRTLRRSAEAGVTGLMAYLVRRTPCLL